ncbi:MAG: putative sensor protein [Verrucomicrobiales bacterium]|nr:putative sensor protein [Verrucomicrobiales bacterium]
MEPKKIRVLLFEDNDDDVLILRHMLHKSRAAHFELTPVDTLSAGIEHLNKRQTDVVLLDLSLPDSRGLETFYAVQTRFPQVPIIVLSGLDDETVALEAVHAGAQDYLVKGHADAQLLTRALIYSIERTQTKTALQSAEEKFRSIFENSVEGIFQTTPDGHYISANPALVRIYGYASTQELMGQMTDIQHQLYVDPNRRNEFIRIMQEKGLVTDFESQIFRKDKSIIWISENARAVRDQAGNILYFEGMVEDITARKRAEDEVRFSEKRFRSVWENALDGMRLTDATGIILAVNPSFCRIVGMERIELEGKPFTVIYSENDNHEEMLLKYRERFTQRKIESQLERHVVFRSGKAVELEVYNSYIEMDRDTLVLGVFHDITVRKQAEERERQATRELAASQAELRMKNEMMEDDLKMAHEIQQAILPQQYPTFPHGVAVEQSLLRFSHRYQPSGEVGGDFFNVLPISPTKAGVFICDVMGHGVRSALVTAMVRALVEELRTIGHDPGLLLMRLNSDLRAILQQTGTPLFTTAFYLVADLETRQVSYANAGHPRPFLIHTDSGDVEMLKNPSQKASPALGLFADSVYPTAQRPLTPGDRFLFYTDGLYEVEGANDELFTQEQLMETVRTNSIKPAATFLDELLSEIKGFAASQKFADDVCLVSMEVAKVETH